MALLNAKGQDVTNAIIKMQRNNPQVFKKNRESILCNLREVLIPSHKHSGTSMFSIEERARVV